MELFSALGNAIKSFIEVIERYAWVLLIVSGFILFVPFKVLEILALEGLSKDQRPVFGLIFLTSIVLLITKWSAFACNQYTKKQKRKNQIRSKLESLSKGEKIIVYHALKNKQQTSYGALNNPFFDSLVDKGLMHHPPQGNMLEYPHTFYDDVWEILKKEYRE